jgi:hypothetical protein
MNSIHSSIVAASGSFSMGCVGIFKREGGTAPTRNVEENRGSGKRRCQVLDVDWVRMADSGKARLCFPRRPEY